LVFLRGPSWIVPLLAFVVRGAGLQTRGVLELDGGVVDVKALVEHLVHVT
jgi:hypothetical protein